MTRYFFVCIFASVAALSVAIGAQDRPTTQPQTQTPTAQQQGQQQGQMATVEGCLVREEDVPGRKPNVVERAGIAEDYILTNAKVVKGSAPGSGASAQAKPGDTRTGTTGAGTSGAGSTRATGTAGATTARTQQMYEVTGLGEERLKPLVGRRVQIDGTFQNVDRAQASKEARTPADDLVEIRGTTVRQVAGNCSAPQQQQQQQPRQQQQQPGQQQER